MYFRAIIPIILFFQNTSKAELVNINFVQNAPNYFDSEYVTFSKSSAFDYLYGYNANSACVISRQNSIWTVHFESINLLKRSSRVQLEAMVNELWPVACFEYGGHSFLIFKNSDTRESYFMRGQKLKILSNLNYEHIKFDHHSGRLFLVEHNQIYEIEQEYMENWWLEGPSDHNNYEILKINFISSLPQNITDFMLFDENIFFAKRPGIIYKAPLENSKEDYEISATNSLVFNYILFKPEAKTSLSQIGAHTTKKWWLYLFYLFDLVMIIILAYVIKRTKLIKKIRRHRKNSSNALSDVDLPVYQSGVLISKHEPEGDAPPYNKN